MHLRRFVAALAVGVLLAVVVAVWVAATLQPYVRLSVLVGLPAGVLVGAVTAALAYRRFDGDHPDSPTGLNP